jgi:hypothetical protein
MRLLSKTGSLTLLVVASGLDLSLSSASTAPQPMGSQRSAALNML